MDAVHLSVDRFCLLAGVEALAEMMEEDATTVCGARHRRHGDRRGYRWGRTHSEIGYHGGKVKVARPRVRDRAGKEVSLESWQALRDGNLLLEWALNLMVLNVSTRKYHGAVRLPEGDLAKARGDGTSKSAVSRRFVALSRKKMKAWLASDLSELDLLVIQIDGLHVGDHVLMAAIGVAGNGDKHVLAVVEGATENTVVVQALIDNLPRQGGSIRRCRGCSSSMARRHSAKRSETPSVWPPPSSAARSTRAVTSSSACPNICDASVKKALPSGLGPGRRKQGRAALAQPGPASAEHEEGVGAAVAELSW